MTRRRGDAGEMVPLTKGDLQRFRRCAPAALARRGGGFVWDELGGAAQWLALGLIPIVGMLYYDWSASQLLLFLLVGTWVSILCDVAKLTQLQTQVRQWAQTRLDDWHVWVVVEALRAGHKKAPKAHLRTKYQPVVGAVLDLVLGVVFTLFICAMMAGSDPEFGLGLLQDRGVAYSLAGLVGYQVLFAVWEIVDHKTGAAGKRQVKVAVGLRGVGLFLLFFLVVLIADSAEKQGLLARAVMLSVNGLIAACGLLRLATLWSLRRETVWLRNYLKKEA